MKIRKLSVYTLFLTALCLSSLTLIYTCTFVSVYACEDPAPHDIADVISRLSTVLKNRQKVIVIDPGHGGYDPGSVYQTLQEKEITLKIAEKLKLELEKQDYQVVLTRSNDDRYWTDSNLEDLEQRVQVSEANQPDLFLSLHLNASEENAHGFEVWTAFSNQEAYGFAENVQRALTKLSYTNARAIRNQDLKPLYVLSHNQAPAILVEMGFITSDADRSFLNSEVGQNEISKALALAVEKTID